MYLTYDLRQTGTQQPKGNVFAHAARELNLPGPVVNWEVGEFADPDTGMHVFGVRVLCGHNLNGTGIGTEVLQVPSHAENVQLREELPDEYRDALQPQTAA